MPSYRPPRKTVLNTDVQNNLGSVARSVRSRTDPGRSGARDPVGYGKGAARYGRDYRPGLDADRVDLRRLHLRPRVCESCGKPFRFPTVWWWRGGFWHHFCLDDALLVEWEGFKGVVTVKAKEEYL